MRLSKAKVIAGVGGAFAALWTHCSSHATFTVLVTAATMGSGVPVATEDATVVVGENMARVNAYAERIGGQTIDDWLTGREWTQSLNDEFVATMKAEGRDFVDIGPDFGRRLENAIDPGLGRPPSAVYGTEREALLNYDNYTSVYQRMGKYDGGVPGFDF